MVLCLVLLKIFHAHHPPLPPPPTHVNAKQPMNTPGERCPSDAPRLAANTHRGPLKEIETSTPAPFLLGGDKPNLLVARMPPGKRTHGGRGCGGGGQARKEGGQEGEDAKTGGKNRAREGGRACGARQQVYACGESLDPRKVCSLVPCRFVPSLILFEAVYSPLWKVGGFSGLARYRAPAAPDSYAFTDRLDVRGLPCGVGFWLPPRALCDSVVTANRWSGFVCRDVVAPPPHARH